MSTCLFNCVIDLILVLWLFFVWRLETSISCIFLIYTTCVCLCLCVGGRWPTISFCICANPLVETTRVNRAHVILLCCNTWLLNSSAVITAALNPSVYQTESQTVTKLPGLGCRSHVLALFFVFFNHCLTCMFKTLILPGSVWVKLWAKSTQSHKSQSWWPHYAVFGVLGPDCKTTSFLLNTAFTCCISSRLNTFH